MVSTEFPSFIESHNITEVQSNLFCSPAVFGMSESGLVAVDPLEGGRHTFTGRLLPNTELRVLGPQGDLLDPDQLGIIHIRSPGVSI